LLEPRKRSSVSPIAIVLAAAALAAVTVAFAVVAVLSFNVFRDVDRGSQRSELKPVQLGGKETTVFRWSRDACESEDYPDAPARAFRDAGGTVHLIASHMITRGMVGRSLGDVRHRCDVLMRSSFNPDPGQFADGEWITSPYTTDGRHVPLPARGQALRHLQPDEHRLRQVRRLLLHTGQGR
jgi:hypothetical protein